MQQKKPRCTAAFFMSKRRWIHMYGRSVSALEIAELYIRFTVSIHAS